MAFDPDKYLAKAKDFDPDSYLSKEPAISKSESFARGAGQGVTLGFQDEASAGLEKGLIKLHNLFSDGKIDEPTYVELRDQFRKDNQEASKANPKSYMGGELTGALATSFVPGANVSKGASLARNVGVGAAQGGLASAGYTEEDLLSKEGLEDVATGTAFGGAGGAVGKGIEKGIDVVGDYLAPRVERIGNTLKTKASDFAENATGATRVQSEKFAPEAGRELLDRGIVKFGDKASDISKKAITQLDDASSRIGQGLSGLDEKGVQVTKEELQRKLQSHIDDLITDESKVKVRKELETILQDLTDNPLDARKLSDVEKVKRGFQKLANYNDPDATEAKKIAASVYQTTVEDRALSADPSLGGMFKQGKEDYKLLAPIEEAATKRAAQLKQHPIGGLLDTSALIAGGVLAGSGQGEGSAAAFALPLARRFVAPRLSSSLAVTTDLLADTVKSAPETFGKYAGLLQDALSRGPRSLTATDFVLRQTDPEYRSMFEDEE